MNKFTKAALASGAGVLLLLGGAGSLAYWNAESDIASGDGIQAGLLTVASAGPGSWSEDLADFVAVPGDEFSYTETLTLTGEGDNLWVELALDDFAITAASAATADVALAAALTESASFTVDGAAYTGAIHLGTGTAEIEVEVTIVFPLLTTVDNSTQQGQVTFDDFALVATQVLAP